MKSLYILIAMVISLFCMSGIYALEFSFDSPEEVQVEEEFEMTIIFQSNEVYDVKAFVQDDTKSYSEIYDGSKWISSFNFLIEVFPSQKTFKLLAHIPAETEICVKLRDPVSKKIVGETCKNIKVVENSGGQMSNQQNQSNQEPQINNSTNNIVEETYVPANTQENFKPSSNDKIVLEYGDEKENKSFITKQEKVRLGVIYGFAGLCVLLIIILAFRKL